MTKSRANSRCRAANVRGESGRGGSPSSCRAAPASPAPDPVLVLGAGGPGVTAPVAAPDGELCDALSIAAALAGIGGFVEFFWILARAGADVGLSGGIAGELSW
jgi:hypothetical protein